jgi:hypothetical protein
MAPAGKPAGSLRISNLKTSSRVGWPSAASADNACGVDIVSAEAGPTWPTTAILVRDIISKTPLR